MACLPQVSGPILPVVGSASDISSGQVTVLAKQLGTNVIAISPSALISAKVPEPGAAARRIETLLSEGKDAVLRISSEAGRVEGRVLSAALARLVAPIARHPAALVVTGGETARAILDEIGVDLLHLVAEIEPGVPLSRMQDRQGPILITKAGAFGDPDTLANCVRALRGG